MRLKSFLQFWKAYFSLSQIYIASNEMKLFLVWVKVRDALTPVDF